MHMIIVFHLVQAATSEEVPISIKPELVSEESMGLDTGLSNDPTPEELSPSSDDYEVG